MHTDTRRHGEACPTVFFPKTYQSAKCLNFNVVMILIDQGYRLMVSFGTLIMSVKGPGFPIAENILAFKAQRLITKTPKVPKWRICGSDEEPEHTAPRAE